MISLNGLDSLLDKLNATSDSIDNPKNILKSAADNIENDTKQAVNNQKSPDFAVGGGKGRKWKPFKHSNGFNPPKMQKIFSGNSVNVEIDEKKYLYQHYGTKASKIVPKNSKVLSFRVDGKQVFSKYANHPGLPSRKFLGYNKDLINKIFSSITNIWSE